MHTVTIVLPGIKAVSRNQTNGHYFAYRDRLMEAEQWMYTYGKRYEHHFTSVVDVNIDAFYDTRLTDSYITNGLRAGKKTKTWKKACDTPNIDDKIFTDILVRHKQQKLGSALERPVWFIEDDSPKYLRYVTKRAIASDLYQVIITISEVVNETEPAHQALDR